MEESEGSQEGEHDEDDESSESQEGESDDEPGESQAGENESEHNGQEEGKDEHETRQENVEHQHDVSTDLKKKREDDKRKGKAVSRQIVSVYFAERWG